MDFQLSSLVLYFLFLRNYVFLKSVKHDNNPVIQEKQIELVVKLSSFPYLYIHEKIAMLHEKKTTVMLKDLYNSICCLIS